MAPSRSTVREKLQKYSFVRTWADRSETVVALRNASLGKVSVGCLSFACCQCARIFVAWLEFFHGLIGVVYTLFVQPFWLALVDHCRLRRFRAIRWCHGDASTSFPSSNGLHEPLTFEKSTEWSSQSSSRLRSKPFGAAVRSECSKYPRRVMCVHCMLLFHCECLCASTFQEQVRSTWEICVGTCTRIGPVHGRSHQAGALSLHYSQSLSPCFMFVSMSRRRSYCGSKVRKMRKIRSKTSRLGRISTFLSG